MQAAQGGGGRVALVTGGASGIGLACAQQLAGAGWSVALLDRDEAALARASVGLRAHPAVRAYSLDVTDEAAVERVVQEVAEHHGGLDGAVNSAGIGAEVPVLDTSLELFRRVIEINLIGTFLVGRASARVMQRRGGGAIVNIASISGLRGGKGRAAYGASKGGVITLTQAMAVDLARYGIRVNAVAPGPIDTPMVRALHADDTMRSFIDRIPLRRYGQPEEIGAAVRFLLDPAMSSYVTGEIIAVDGGFRGAGVMDPRP